jgi:paraquat-inducible protein B
MSDPGERSPAPSPPPQAPLRRPRFSVVWLIPILAAAIAIYLGYKTLTERGPLLTLTFATAEGLTPGQTQLQYKAVDLGTVESIALGHEHRDVIVEIRMNDVGTPFLTDHARFWVVRPSFSAGSISGLQTLVSGDYIAVDPGLAGGKFQDHFVGLEEPPGVRSDEPGHTYILKADDIGSLGSGSPVFYRDVAVGEVLGYNLGNGFGPVTVNIFVRSPYDQLVRTRSHFWNSSGIAATIQNGAFHIEFQSLQAIISGGVTFDVPPEARSSAPAANDSVFPLYASQSAAQSAGYQRKIPLVTYFDSSVGGLARGAPVEVLGIQVGQVTDVKLQVDLQTATVKVRVAMELQPERVFATSILPPNMTMKQGIQSLVNGGLHVEIATANYVTGEQIITLVMLPGTSAAPISNEGEAFVLPSTPGAFDNLLASFSGISKKLSSMPFGEIATNANKLLITANNTLDGHQMKLILAELSKTLTSTNTTLSTLDQSYGGDSQFQMTLERLMTQANDALQSIDQLTSYLDRHPESLLRGRGGQ